MKLEQVALEVERSSPFAEKEFGFAHNSALYELLSSKVYSDVPLAIVRELSTNASDSHVDAGKGDMPFDVHLPNVLEPWFAIRDYGTGLSPEGIDAVYRMYGESTRTKSDDFTGCLGIGSKSPFAYTDQFTIVSNWHGKKYTYSAFKNEQHIPSIAQLGVTDTDECNGLEIRVAIRPGDDREFVQAAQRVYLHFKVRPNITGATIDFSQAEPIVQADNFKLYDKSNTYHKDQISVVMGQVCYSVDESKIGCPILGYSAAITLNMPVGSCRFAASREELQYDDITVTRVREALFAAVEVAKTQFEASVSDEPYMLMKLSKLAKYGEFVRGLSVQGTSSIYSIEEGKYAIKKASIRRGDKLFIHQAYHEFRGNFQDVRTIFVEEDIEDMTQNVKNRLRAFIRSNGGGTVYLAKIQDQARFTELFGPTNTKLSLLPDVPRAIRNTNSRTSARSKPIKCLRNANGDNMIFDWENVNDASEIDITDACCVPRDGNWVIWNGQRVRPNQIRKIAVALGFKRVYGIAEKRYDTSRVRYNIPELSALAKSKTEALIAGLDKYALAKFSHDISYERRFDAHKLPRGLSSECDDYINAIMAKTDKIEVYRELANTLGVEMPVTTNYQDAFFEKYPILLAINPYGGNINMDHIVQYIKLIEANQPQTI